MQYQYPHLCAPITIAGVTFRNRMFSAPMGGTDITNDGCIGPKSTAFYELAGQGGAGAVTVSECMVHPATDAPTPTIWTRASSTLWLPPPYNGRCHPPPRCHAQPGTLPLRHVLRYLYDR